MKRRILVATVWSLALAGGVFTVFPFIASMDVSEKSLNNSPHIYVADLKKNEYRYVPKEDHWYASSSLLVYRGKDNLVRAYIIPKHDDRFLKYAIAWDGCKTFGPEVKEVFILKCFDDGLSDYQNSEWRWDINGKNLGKHTKDIHRATGQEKHGFYVINQYEYSKDHYLASSQ